MKKLAESGLGDVFFVVFLLVSCNVIKHLPADKVSGLFSLNGNWRLEHSSDHSSLAGSTVSVLPISDNGVVNGTPNTDCSVKPNDVLWKDISTTHDGYALSTLSTNQTKAAAYLPATITVIAENEIKLVSSNVIQTWKRISN